MGSRMFSKILVGFDGTDTGHDGMALSMGLAKAFGSRVLVAYVYDEELAEPRVRLPRSWASTPMRSSPGPERG